MSKGLIPRYIAGNSEIHSCKFRDTYSEIHIGKVQYR
jgi:hypothetical protein